MWRPAQTEHVQLVAGGSGLVPLMAMIRARAAAHSDVPFRLLYSVRNAEAALYAEELRQISASVPVTFVYTCQAPAGSSEPAHRIDAPTIAKATWPPSINPICYVCGPTAFVETAADLLRNAGHDAARIKTERFGPSGGS